MKRILSGFLPVVLVVSLAACSVARVAEKKVVQVSYTLTVDGAVFDQSPTDQPLEFMVGAGKMIPGFETAIIGLQAGEKKSFDIKAVDGYGEHDESKVIEVPLDQFPKDNLPQVGQSFSVTTPAGAMPVLIKAVGKTMVTVDLNSPLAGKDLSFAIEIVKIRDATKEETATLQAESEATAQ